MVKYRLYVCQTSDGRKEVAKKNMHLEVSDNRLASLWTQRLPDLTEWCDRMGLGQPEMRPDYKRLSGDYMTAIPTHVGMVGDYYLLLQRFPN